jgi:hypothetical protein
MKYFRDGRFFAWALICAAGVAVLIAALKVGQSREAELPTRIPDRASAVADIDGLRTRLIDLPTVAAPPALELPSWALETARLADEAANRRRLQGASASDGIVVGLQTLASDARKLAGVDRTDAMAVHAAAVAVGADADALATIIGGGRPDGLLPRPSALPASASPTPSLTPALPPSSVPSANPSSSAATDPSAAPVTAPSGGTH